jgi:heme-degrading monooxygenase HmoA
LAAHAGFLHKETWLSLDDPDLVTLIIRWASLAQWQQFPAALLAELDTRLEDLQVSLTCEAYEAAP